MRSWTKEELQAASEAMKRTGHLGYEEFCKELKKMQTEKDSNTKNKKQL